MNLKVIQWQERPATLLTTLVPKEEKRKVSKGSQSGDCEWPFN